MRKVLCFVEYSSQKARADDDDGEKARRYFQQRKRDGQAAASEYMERGHYGCAPSYNRETQNSAGTRAKDAACWWTQKIHIDPSAIESLKLAARGLSKAHSHLKPRQLQIVWNVKTTAQHHFFIPLKICMVFKTGMNLFHAFFHDFLRWRIKSVAFRSKF